MDNNENEFWESLEYHDPENILINLRDTSETIDSSELPDNVSSLRTYRLRKFVESRLCAIFCYGIAETFNLDIKYAQFKSSTSDYAAVYAMENRLNYFPIEIIELVPGSLDEETEIIEKIQMLEEYEESEDLCVAIHCNRPEAIKFNELKIPKLKVKELWLFGATSPEQDTWRLIGDLTQEPNMYEFNYPTASPNQ